MSQNDAILTSVIICTRDRAASLARTLQSLVDASRLVTDPWELIVIDNGSSDDTADRARTFASDLPIRVVTEPKAGLSNARNAGVAASVGRYILWTDDDVLVDRHWLSAWFDAFSSRPDDAVFGGRSEPVLQEPQQPWFRDAIQHMPSLLAIRDDPSWTAVTTTQIPYGLNYAIRGTEQRAFLYDPELGVAPGRRRGGEEVAVLRAILATGATGSWVWGATVYHLIPPARQTPAYIRQFYRSNGYDFPIMGNVSSLPRRARASVRAVRVIAKTWLALRGKSAPDVPALIRLARAQGSLDRYLGRAG